VGCTYSIFLQIDQFYIRGCVCAPPGVLAAVSVVALSATGGAALSSPRARAAAPPKGTGTRYPLHLPPTTSPASLNLSEAPAVVDLGGGHYSNVLAYNGFFPGPSLVAKRGDSASIHLVNDLSEQTITHWHGMIVDERNDGGPRYVIAPGATYDYAFTINQRACLNWYHPHPHMLTGEQVNLGLACAFIVRDTVDDGVGGLGLPSGAREVPLIIRDATLDSYGNLQYKRRTGGFDGQIPLVNGTLSPYLAVDQGLYASASSTVRTPASSDLPSPVEPRSR
jgi:blue copper oxidase